MTMSHLSCGCTLCARLLAEEKDWPVADATQEDLLCDPCRAGVCAGAVHYGPPETVLEQMRAALGVDSLDPPRE